jgi:aspartate/methionine/tyrosine aminotransferase
LADYRGVGGRFTDDTAFAMWLTKEVGVACVPGSSFFHDPERGRHLVRFAYPKKEETLKAAAQRLSATRGKAEASSGTARISPR